MASTTMAASMMPMDGGTADSGGDAGVGNDAGADAASEDSSIADGGPIDMGAVVCDPIDSSADEGGLGGSAP
jgi:hypothetical protein